MIGSVSLGVGLALAAAALSRHDDAVNDLTPAGGREKQASAVSLMHTANLTMIAGGTLAAAGIVWWIIDAASVRRSAKPPTTEARLHVGPGSVAALVTF